MKPPGHAIRQRLRRIETKPKPVHAVQFQDFAGIGKKPALRAELDGIIERIERGHGVPEVLYWAGVARWGLERIKRPKDGLFDSYALDDTTRVG